MKRFAAACLLSLAVGTGLAANPSDDTPPLTRWPAGPVRYLLTRKEEKDYRALPDDRARALFIVRFWHRLDPTPGTIENENRRVYWHRVQEATRQFRDSVRPGWKTDRGRIFILLGAPDDTLYEDSPSLRSGADLNPSSITSSSGPTGQTHTSRDFDDTPDRGLLRWTYRNLPGKQTDPETIFAFVRDSSGEWRLSRDPENYTLVFPGLGGGARDQDFGGVTGGTVAGPAAGGAAAAGGGGTFEGLEAVVTMSAVGAQGLLNLDLGDALRIPEEKELRGEIVTSQEFLGRLPLRARVGFLQGGGNTTLVQIGAAVPPRDLYRDEQVPADARSFLLLYARLSPKGEGTPIYGSNEAAPRPVSGDEIHRTGTLLSAWITVAAPPGKYDLAYGLQDAATGAISSDAVEIEVPPPASGLSLSSLLPAAGVHREADTGLSADFLVDARFRKDEQFGVYFQIYGLGSDGESAPYDLEYRFDRFADGRWQPIGSPIAFPAQTGGKRGWSFPLARWPAGKYRLDAKVHAGASDATGSLEFEVVDPAAPTAGP